MRPKTLLAISFVALHLLSMTAARYAHATVDTANWMTDYQDKTLGELTLPGSHDAGMSTPQGPEITHCRGGAFYNITVTQNTDVAGQLALGARVFDVRPVMYDGRLYTAHGTQESIDAIGLQLNAGCRGQSINSLLTQMRDFLERHPNEVVIINAHNIDYHTGMFSDASGMEVAAAFKTAAEAQLGDLLFRPQDFPSSSLTRDVWNMTVGDLVGQNRRLIINMECKYTEITRGFLGCLPAVPGPLDVSLAKTTGPWANSPHAAIVASRVMSGWRAHVSAARTTGFEMSWTATMDTNCTVGAFSWKLFGIPPSRLPAFMKRLLTRAGIELEGYDHCRSIKTITEPLHALLVPELSKLKAEGYLCPHRKPRIVSLDFVDTVTGKAVATLNDADTYMNAMACAAR